MPWPRRIKDFENSNSQSQFCGVGDFYVSFTIADDGKVFYTYEPRAATTADRILQ